jgi:hypothetical protein
MSSRRASFHLTAAVGALPAATPNMSRLAQAAGLITGWVDDGAPLVAVGDTLHGATLYRAFRTAAQHLVFADELGTALHEMSYPLVNEAIGGRSHPTGRPMRSSTRRSSAPRPCPCRATTSTTSRAPGTATGPGRGAPRGQVLATRFGPTT